MHEEATHCAVEEATLEERSNLIQLVSLPSSCERVQEVEESSSVHNIKTENDDGLFLSNKLDKEGFCEGFDFILGQWTGKPYIRVNGFGWIFKLVIWCLR